MSTCPGEFDTEETPKFYTKPREFMVKLDGNSMVCTLSERGKDWLMFSDEVLKHIECYTVPQYGDKGDDQCTDFIEHDFITQLKRYLNRHGKNSRKGQNRLDKIKMAHYAQMLHDLIED